MSTSAGKMRFRRASRQLPCLLGFIVSFIAVTILVSIATGDNMETSGSFLDTVRSELTSNIDRVRGMYDKAKLSNVVNLVSPSPTTNTVPVTEHIDVASTQVVTERKVAATQRNAVVITLPTTQSNVDKFAMVRQRFEDRKKLLRQTCVRVHQDIAYSKCEKVDAKFNFKFVSDSNLVYCAIEKTGSTFWKRILHVIGGWGNTSNPTLIKTSDADIDNGGFRTMVGKTRKEVTSIFNRSANIMFVRDPLTKVFSGWLDKFYSPNAYYWKELGLPIANIFRTPEHATNTSTTCGYDVTFEEFVRYLVKKIRSKQCLDGHFSPNYKHCMQCDFRYDYIGKYETLQEDTSFLLHELNYTDTVKFSDFRSDAAYDAINGMSIFIFQNKENIENCGVSMHCALFKAFKRLQARGLLSKWAQYPYKKESDVDNLTAAKFCMDMLELHRLGDEDEMKLNRNEAIAQAFKSLPRILLAQFKEAFFQDFKMFNYTLDPYYLDTSLHKGFDYFEDCPVVL